MPRATSYTGVDVVPGPAVDLVIAPNQTWPLAANSFDVVLCSQVLEHAVDPDHVLREISRVARPGSTVIVSFPFLYNEHGAPNDYRRLSTHGARELFRDWQGSIDLRTQGGVGSTLGVLWLNWLDAMIGGTVAGLAARTALMPAWLLLCFLVNVTALAVDAMDRSGRFYGNVLVVARLDADESP